MQFLHDFAKKSLTLHPENALQRFVAGASERSRERKVRAALGTPLPKVEAIGDNRCRQKKITASFGVRVRRWCKRPPASG